MSDEWRERLKRYTDHLYRNAWTWNANGRPEFHPEVAQRVSVCEAMLACETEKEADAISLRYLGDADRQTVWLIMEGTLTLKGMQPEQPELALESPRGREVPDPYGREGVMVAAPEIDDGGIDR